MFALLGQFGQELITTTAQATVNGTTTATTSSDPSAFADIAKTIASFSIARDWIKLFVLGTVLETIRRFADSAWTSLLDSFFLTAQFESDDDAYNWMMVWVSKQPMKKARDVQVSTRVRPPFLTDTSFLLTTSGPRSGALTFVTTLRGQYTCQARLMRA